MGPEKLEICELATFEKVVARINELPQPVAIILFGTDSDFKMGIYAKCIKTIPHLSYNHEIAASDSTINDALAKTKPPLDNKHNVLILIDGESSCNHSERRQAATMLKENGAKSVVGFYARTKPKPINPFMSPLERLDQNRQAASLLHNPPTAESLDFLVTFDGT